MIYENISSNKISSYVLFTLMVAFVAFLGFFIGTWYGNSYAGVIIAAIIAILYSLISYYSGDKIALSISHAVAATRKDHAYLINTVEGLAIAAGLPKPTVYVMNEDAINAFATGRNPENSSIAVTTGALKKLNRQELEGVIAHEMSHIGNYDIRFMMLVVVMIGMISIISSFFIRMMWFGGGSNDNKGNIGIILALVGVVLAIFAPLIGEIIRLAISRKREYLADASGALLTRYPQGLANALKKIKQENMPMKKVDKSVAALFIANPLKAGWLNNIFSTHPPVEERIRRLESM
jgi:heat shock protein HtpX